MLNCLIVTGALYLSNGIDIVRHDQVWSYKILRGHLYAFSGGKEGRAFDLAPEQTEWSPEEIVVTCIANATEVSPVTN